MIDGAACTPAPGAPPLTHLFFPDGTQFRGVDYDAEARRVRDIYCRHCPSATREACIRLFTEQRDGYDGGVWGGTTEADRRLAPLPLCSSCSLPLDPLTARYTRRCHQCRDTRNTP